MRPRVGLILGGGAARGYAHLGILKRFEEENIPIDFIIGISMGAIIGAIYASGHNVDKLISDAKKINMLKFISLLDFKASRTGLVKGEKIEKYLRGYVKESFEELNIPLYIVATDIQTGKGVVFKEGDLIKAIRASISIPVFFEPVEYNGTKLVDGSIIDSEAIELAASLGADIIINCDVSSSIDMGFFERFFYSLANSEKVLPIKKYFNIKRPLPEIISITTTAIKLLKDNSNKNLEKMEGNKRVYTIKPNVDNIRWYRFDQAEKCINMGFEAVDSIVARIKRELEM
ncbi:patatin family protein [Caldanaerobacter subterraneus KAk]|uniref:patatin family protein n=1 Tax=Caldanaerobacter subterraneus TaxID=911092 RepID=UPI0032C16876